MKCFGFLSMKYTILFLVSPMGGRDTKHRLLAWHSARILHVTQFNFRNFPVNWVCGPHVISRTQAQRYQCASGHTISNSVIKIQSKFQLKKHVLFLLSYGDREPSLLWALSSTLSCLSGPVIHLYPKIKSLII